jgi:hypothetical protein
MGYKSNLVVQQSLADEMAERQGFEPWIGVTYTRFPGVRLQPLGHLSTPNDVDRPE